MTDRKFTDDELADCADRELKMRKRVYQGMMINQPEKRPELEKQIAMMEEIRDFFNDRANDQGDLFDE